MFPRITLITTLLLSLILLPGCPGGQVARILIVNDSGDPVTSVLFTEEIIVDFAVPTDTARYINIPEGVGVSHSLGIFLNNENSFLVFTNLPHLTLGIGGLDVFYIGPGRSRGWVKLTE